MGLSAWGAGKRIENYQRERITSFEKLKKCFGKNLEELYNPFKKHKPGKTNYQEIESLKNKIRDRRYVFKLVRNIFVLICIASLFLLLYQMWNSG